MAGHKIVLCFFYCTFALICCSQYTDDSDYNEINFYEEVNFIEERKNNNRFQNPKPDDFYILEDYEDLEEKNVIDLDENESEITAQSKLPDQVKRYKIPERVYRYTKHRIPGYDYDELDFLGSRNSQKCGERSLWTHCVCQFTCSEPDVVDCYSPCESGCECKEDYVFDERTRQCLLPEQCYPKEDHSSN